MKTEWLPNLAPEGIRLMKEALASAPHEPAAELPGALRLHEQVRRWWSGLTSALAQGLEGSQARTLLTVQMGLCSADKVFLQLALDNRDESACQDDVTRATTALAEVREIEATSRAWLDLASLPTTIPVAEKLTHAVAEYEQGKTEPLAGVVTRLKQRRSS
jgi:hypothetical protein